MTVKKGYKATFIRKPHKIIGLLALLLLMAFGAAAQNTKGDKPIPNQKQVREAKFKTVKKRKKVKTRDISGRRLRTLNKSSASRANRRWRQPDPYSNRKQKGETAAKPRGRIFDKPPSDRARAWQGNISGHKIRIQSSKSQSARSKNVYPQSGPFVNYSSRDHRPGPRVHTKTASGVEPIKRIPQDRQRAWKGNIKGGPVGTPSRSGQHRKIYPQSGRFVNHSSKSGKAVRRSLNNESNIRNAARREANKPPRRGLNIFPRSRTSPYVVRGRKNVYWGKFSKGERAFTRDISGRPLRTRNYRSTPAGLISRDSLKFFPRRPGGDRPYSGKGGGGFSISGRQKKGGPLPPRAPGIGARGINYSGRFKQGELRPGFSQQGIGYSGNIKRGQRAGFSRQGLGYSGNIRGGRKIIGGAPVDQYQGNIRRSQRPGFTRQGLGYAGNIKGGRKIIGGAPVDQYRGNIRRGQSAGFTRQGIGFSGTIKARRPAQGGVSVSGKRWNNDGNPIPVRTPRGGAGIGEYSGTFRRGELSPGFTKQGIGFAGNIKTRRPAKGGGSVSGKRWNNNNTPIPVRTPKGGAAIGDYSGRFRKGELSPGFTKQGVDFAGNIKTRRPAKGGGSVSGKLWNNNNTPIPVRTPKGGTGIGDYSGTFRKGELSPGFTKQGVDFAGNIKTRRPAKGGGSISGKLWNNNGTPIPGRVPPGESRKASGFPGNYKLFDLKPSRQYQGEEYTGNIKFKKPKKGGGSISGEMWNNDETPIEVRRPIKEADMAGYSGRTKLSGLKRNYVQNPNASSESLKKQRPDKSTFEVAGLQVKVKEGNYRNKPHAAKGSLPGVAPSKSSMRAGEYARGVKVNWKYKQNPNSDSEALKGRAPDKAYARIGDYQGNIKMRKYNDNRLHPDAQFAHSFRDNVKEERTIFMNIKLMWAKLFRKSETQPDHLKDRVRRPRYDKREKGLWYE